VESPETGQALKEPSGGSNVIGVGTRLHQGKDGAGVPTGWSEKVAVDRRIATSTAVISAGTSANNGVVRYRSPVSGSMQRMVDPAGAPAATSSAAAKVPPAEMPTKIPSFAASS
jgi:hypothetical protein